MSGKCDNCLNNLNIGLYQYINNSYCITDINDNIIRVVHDIPGITGEETIIKDNIKYCTNIECNKFFTYPIDYKYIDSDNKEETNELIKFPPRPCSDCFILSDAGWDGGCKECGGDLTPEMEMKPEPQNFYFITNEQNYIIKYYQNFLNDNIIHNFTNINCKYCKNRMEKGYIRIKKDEQAENGYLTIDFLICNEDTDEVIKEVNINNINFNPKLNINDLTSSISRKLLYCNNCFYGIFNNLQDMDMKIKVYEISTFTEEWE